MSSPKKSPLSRRVLILGCKCPSGGSALELKSSYSHREAKGKFNTTGRQQTTLINVNSGVSISCGRLVCQVKYEYARDLNYVM